jgi:hypothetical protein
MRSTRRGVTPRTRSALLVLALCASGCWVKHAYLLDPPELARASTLPIGDTVAATREKDGQAVRVRVETLKPETARPAGARVRVVSAAHSRMVLAGSLLTWIGSAISIAGTVMALATHDGDVHTAGLVLAPSAEPLMITGTVLWVVGAIRHPQEAGAP